MVKSLFQFHQLFLTYLLLFFPQNFFKTLLKSIFGRGVNTKNEKLSVESKWNIENFHCLINNKKRKKSVDSSVFHSNPSIVFSSNHEENLDENREVSQNDLTAIPFNFFFLPVNYHFFFHSKPFLVNLHKLHFFFFHYSSQPNKCNLYLSYIILLFHPSN